MAFVAAHDYQIDGVLFDNPHDLALDTAHLNATERFSQVVAPGQCIQALAGTTDQVFFDIDRRH
jgi:hypothetical protein